MTTMAGPREGQAYYRTDTNEMLFFHRGRWRTADECDPRQARWHRRIARSVRRWRHWRASRPHPSQFPYDEQWRFREAYARWKDRRP